MTALEHARETHGACKLILTGALAGSRAFGQQQTTADPGRDDGTLLMVARTEITSSTPLTT